MGVTHDATAIEGRVPHGYRFACSCGWPSGWFVSVKAARHARSRHLADASACRLWYVVTDSGHQIFPSKAAALRAVGCKHSERVRGGVYRAGTTIITNRPEEVPEGDRQ